MNVIKGCLVSLLEKKYLKDFQRPIMYLIDNYTEEQLEYMLFHGRNIDINENFRLVFNRGMGFRCLNNDSLIRGRLPLCNNIEKTLNGTLNKFYS